MQINSRIIEKPSDNQIDTYVFDLLVEYNLKQEAYKPAVEYLYQFYNETQDIIGGIVFEIRADWLEIEYTAISEKYRNLGLGKRMLKEVEEFAVKKGCSKCLVSTYAFQAPKFYQKYGYKLVYEQKFDDNRSTRYFMEKRLI